MKKSKEKIERHVMIVVQPSLYNQFFKICEENYKTVSETIRELMVGHVKKSNKRRNKVAGSCKK